MPRVVLGGSLLGKISNPSKVLLASLSVIVLLALISSFAFFSTFSTSSAYADPNGSASATADVVLNLTSAISIRTLDSAASSEIESLNLELTPTPSGRFTKDTTIVDVATSNTTGYMLYMASDYTNPHTSTSESPVYTTDMIHSGDTSVASNYSIPTITLASGTTISEAEFSMANSSYKNRWGYSLTEKNVSGTYNAIPAHSSPDTINSTVSTAVEHSYTPVTVGVNVDTNIASGTYTNELEFTAIANALPITYSLEFDANGSDSGNPGTTTPTDITDATISSLPSPNPMTNSTTASSYTFTIPSTTPETSVAGYAFKEWNTSPDGTGTSYQPGDTFQIVADTSLIDPGARTIYAIWEESNFWTITYMQEMTPEICADATTPDKTATTNADTDGSHAGDTSYVPETTLIDYRGIDGTGTAASPATGSNQVSYKVRKLADGNCWMTQNLRLTLSTSTALEVATFDGNTTSWTPNSTTSSNAYNYAITPNTLTNQSVTSAINTKNGGNAWYYPWYAATAGQGTQTASPTITQSICPKGWRLPLGTTVDKSFYNLITTKYGLESSAAGSTSLQSFPLDFTLSGSVTSGSQHSAGSLGRYWSASPGTRNASNACLLYFVSSSIYPQFDGNNGYKYVGYPVRCVSI